MLKIKIEGKEYNVKDDWSEITFYDFVHMVAIDQDVYSEFNKLIKIIVYLSDAQDKSEFENLLLNLDVDNFKILQENYTWIKEDVTKIEAKNPNSYFIIDNQKYKIKKEFQKLTVGEMVSLEMLLKNNNLDLTPYEIAFGVLIRKIDENGNEVEFSGEIFEETIKKLRDQIMVVDIIHHISFFLRGAKIYTKKNSKDFSITKTMTSTKECLSKKSKNTKKKKKEN